MKTVDLKLSSRALKAQVMTGLKDWNIIVMNFHDLP